MLCGMTRRDLFRLAVALPAGSFLTRYAALAAPYRGKVKISAIKAMGIKTATGNCLIRVDTDAGLSGYGEAGATGAMARARIETMKSMLIGKDPLAIEQHFHQYDHADAHLHGAHPHHQRHRHGALGPGRQNHRPARLRAAWAARSATPSRCTRTAIGLDMLDPGSCRDWAQRIKARPEGFTAFKNSIDPRARRARRAKYTDTLDQRAAPQSRHGLHELPRGGRQRDRNRRPLPQRVRYTERDRRRQSCRADGSAVPRGSAQRDLTRKAGWR